MHTIIISVEVGTTELDLAFPDELIPFLEDVSSQPSPLVIEDLSRSSHRLCARQQLECRWHHACLLVSR